MKIKKTFQLSIVVSLVLHGSLLGVSTQWEVMAPVGQEKKEKRIQVKNLKIDIPEFVRTEVNMDQNKDILKLEQPGVSEIEIENESPLKKTMELDHYEMLKDFDIEPMQLTKAVEPQDVVESKDNYNVLKQKMVRQTRESLLKKIERPLANTFSIPSKILEEANITEEFFDKMAGFTPQLVKMGGKEVEGISEFGKRNVMVVKRKTNVSDLKKYLDHDLAIYTDQKDGQKYFKISIRAGNASSKLSAIPKEIVYLVDCSISTQKQRLDQFKEGISYSLKHLNSTDKFNIVAFKKTVTKFSPASVDPSKDNIEKALQFVAGLTAGEKTDAYDALYRSVGVDDRMNPSYLIFLSDGRPTKGIVDSRQLINEVSRVNNTKTSIFAFSGGLRVNRYLLDFISYKNRGWTEYSYRTNMIGKNLSNMYDKIRDPLLLDLSFKTSGLNRAEMFPKILPDFFRNTEFTLYGKYTDENKFVVQMLGEKSEKVNEFLIESALLEAEVGDASIARNWAFNKIYHLIGLLEYDKDNVDLVKKIHILSKKFKIDTPYSKNIR